MPYLMGRNLMMLDDILKFMTDAGADGVDFSYSRTHRALIVRPYKMIGGNLFYFPQAVSLRVVQSRAGDGGAVILEEIRDRFKKAVEEVQSQRGVEQEPAQELPPQRRKGFLRGGYVDPGTPGL